MDEASPSHKKHKKHKKHKHKKRAAAAPESGGEDSGGELNVYDTESLLLQPPPSQPHTAAAAKPIKLKIKFGATLGTEKNGVEGQSGVLPAAGESGQSVQGDGKASSRKAGDDTSEEEQEWLEALEAGNLNDYGEVNRSRGGGQKEPSLLTARQRALLHGPSEETLLQLPSGYKTAGELTEEQLQKRQQRAKIRREQAHERREKDKKQTLDRLLKKSDTKGKASKAKGSRRTTAPCLRYHDNKDGMSISVPAGVRSPFQTARAPAPKPKTICGASGCGNIKKYACKRTGIPLCSLECYKRNMTERGLL